MTLRLPFSIRRARWAMTFCCCLWRPCSALRNCCVHRHQRYVSQWTRTDSWNNDSRSNDWLTAPTPSDRACVALATMLRAICAGNDKKKTRKRRCDVTNWGNVNIYIYKERASIFAGNDFSTSFFKRRNKCAIKKEIRNNKQKSLLFKKVNI